ncbi:hypothetical protein C3B55_00624 [Candidatus Pseudomonas adelgestsugas]|uniref:Uncharacterized protein n=1 Tax=Candidatus Pseudomonas adelgestsugas TaxID=1302376 RepID=A0ABX5R8R7_9PSED|nr:hypothetical protein C3B55_00624 [Candidatus Pseudomonas adelgestsugas]
MKALRKASLALEEGDLTLCMQVKYDEVIFEVICYSLYMA